MAYSQTTRAALESALFTRLGDQVFWSNTGAYPEIRSYLREALRVWNCLANFWRDRITFATVAGQAFYRITDPALTTNPAAFLNFTVTDTQVIAEMQYHLLETQPLLADPVDPTTWRGTDQFDLVLVRNAVSRRLNQFLHETAISLRREVVAGVIGSEGRMDLPDTVLDVRRVAWQALDNTHTHLWREDEWAAQSIVPTWAYTPDAPPSSYSLILTPPVRLQIIPPPSLGGQVDLISSRSVPQLASGDLMSLPDDWVWAVKWGALADLLGAESQARDPVRAAYCEQRWQQAIAVAKLDPDVLWGQINGQPLILSALHDMDSMDPGWQDTSAQPVYIAVERDIVALNPVPDGVYSVTLDIVGPAPIPATDLALVQVGPEILDAILDYAHHIGSFKEGGAEFAATSRQLDNMIRLAADYNRKLNALSVFRETLEDRSIREETRRARREPMEVEA